MILILAAKFLFYIFLLVLGVWIPIIWKTRRIRHETRNLYHLKYKPLPLIGHLYIFLKSRWDHATAVFIDALCDASEKDIQTACIWMGPFPIVLVWGAEDVQKVLTSSATNEKSEEYKYFKFVFGDGLFTAPNNIWRISRSHANPVFHPRNVELLIPSMNKNCRELVLSLSSRLDSDQFNVFEYSIRTSLKSISHLLFGPEFTFNEIPQEFDRLAQMFDRIPELILERVRKPWLWNESIFSYVHKKDLSEMEYIVKTVTETHMKELRKDIGKHSQRRVDEDGSDANNFFLNGISFVLEAYRSLQKKWESSNDKYIMDEIITLYATGADTVAATVSLSLVALAQYPDIQDKLYNEIELIVDDDEITLEQIKKMQYLDQFFNEVLRISLIGPVIARKCTEDLKLSQCTIPAGNTVGVMLVGVHRNPKVYHNPKSFNPDRFSPENSSNRRENTFLPFSRGPRNCIAKRYAELLVKLMVAHVVRHYKMSTDMNIHTMKKNWVITLVSSEGYNIKLQSRSEKCS